MQEGYREVLKSTETTADFDASGEQLLVVKYSGSELTLSLLTPEPEPTELNPSLRLTGLHRLKAMSFYTVNRVKPLERKTKAV